MKATHSTHQFSIEEATIADLHRAIQEKRITCVQVVQQYLARIQQYNGPSSLLVTESGQDIESTKGVVRGGKAICFDQKTIQASQLLPDLDQYQGTALEFGRMDATVSDPGVMQQFGMIVGKPNSGQLNALATINIRGEPKTLERIKHTLKTGKPLRN